MRVGQNPNKNIDKEISSSSYHRIVVPVFIPNLVDEYFKNSFNVLKVCIESLLLTIHDKSRLSVINNGCCNEVEEYLNMKYVSNSKFDQLLHTKINLGKINAAYSVIKSNQEDLITVTDADVLFKEGWQQGIESVFKNFPEAGMVSPVPHSRGFANFGYSNAFFAFFKGKIFFDEVRDPDDQLKFEESLQRNILKPIHFKKYLVLQNTKGKAVMGCGHFVATYRKEVFLKSPNFPSKDFLSTKSDFDYLDHPNEKAGFLRLATLNNFAYHLGNVYEDWMDVELEKIRNSNSISKFTDIPKFKSFNQTQISIGKFINRLFFHKFRKWYFKYLGEETY
ncbi:MAG: glycosyltransferase family A protein [Algoriphagus sp.]|uniref:glycosyltransferase family A protein n=1 Tax=Algoriphagus sp. TaxID=1872435 RepID=UPI0027343618|nr:glycosyltransferase family A protein [Algoriphagus sp.]MDP3201793.1 glycosyltransferase family A protein [Algoriphagus sp.]